MSAGDETFVVGLCLWLVSKWRGQKAAIKPNQNTEGEVHLGVVIIVATATTTGFRLLIVNICVYKIKQKSCNDIKIVVIVMVSFTF